MKALKLMCYGILLLMLGVTVWASLDKNVLEGFAAVFREPWAAATLADAYSGFLTFYAWVFYKESLWIKKITWFVLIMALGNFAMSGYLLWQMYRLGPQLTPERLLLKNNVS